MNSLLLVFLATSLVHCTSHTNDETRKITDPDVLRQKEFWENDAQRQLYERISARLYKNVAKNVIFFIGDGMSLATVTAARIYEGQQHGFIGERNLLSFERFPFVALSQTYCSNARVADSACSATAYHCGVKVNYETLGVTSNVTLRDCEAELDPANQLTTILQWATAAGKSTGIVTNTRVTHASPAGAYAHSSYRDYEADSDIPEVDRGVCRDIAKQMVENEGPRQFNVIFGGGRKKFFPTNVGNGTRADGRNLVEEWLAIEGGHRVYVDSREKLLNVNVQETDYLLGLFNDDHLNYNSKRLRDEPSLVEMVDKAIDILAKNEKGYYLFVESGRIDIAHHNNMAAEALSEAVHLSETVKHAVYKTDPRETLIVVSADHSHTMSINGYSDVDTKITAFSDELAADGLPYTTLSYANGPAFSRFLRVLENGAVGRVDLTEFNDIGNLEFQYPGAVLLDIETHGGDDVPIYAYGAGSHLFTGVIEQSSLPIFMGYAACIGPGATYCRRYYG